MSIRKYGGRSWAVYDAASRCWSVSASPRRAPRKWYGVWPLANTVPQALRRTWGLLCPWRGAGRMHSR